MNTKEIAETIIEHEALWVLGGYENAHADNGDPLPTAKDMFDEVYDLVLSYNGITASGIIYEEGYKIRFVDSDDLEQKVKEIIAEVIEDNL